MAHAHPTPRPREELQSEGGLFAPIAPSLEVCEPAAVYRPRNPAESVLYGVVAGHVETFLEAKRRRDRCVPRFVERELRSFLDCGILANQQSVESGRIAYRDILWRPSA